MTRNRRPTVGEAPTLTRLTTELPGSLKSWLRMRAATQTNESGQLVTITMLVIEALERYRRAVERRELRKENTT